MQPKPQPYQGIGYQLGKLKKKHDWRCQDCHERCVQMAVKPLVLYFLDHDRSNRDPSNLRLLCIDCVRNRIRAMQRGLKPGMVQPKIF